ncbi:TonB-dependent receptor [bacterium]|nr:TonB-dependent receptor [candidate division CSSED10-310 bacterium]
MDIQRLVAAVILATVSAQVLRAQDARNSFPIEFETQSGRPVYSTTVVVKERVDPHSLDELPAFVTVIRLDPEEPRFQTLPEILSRSVGVSIRDFGGLGKLSTVSIRGASANQVLVLLNGVRLNTASGSGVDLSTVSLANIEKIEILRGADSAVFGDGAMGGVINLVSRESRVTRPRFNAALTCGSFNTLASSAGFDHRLADLEYGFNGHYQRSNGDFDFTNNNGTELYSGDDYADVRTNNDFDSLSGKGWWRLAGSGKWKFNGTMEAFRSEKGIPGIITFPSAHARQADRRMSANIRFERNRSPDQSNGLFGEIGILRTGLDFSDPMGEQTGVPVFTHQRSLMLETGLGYRFTHSRGTGSVSVNWSHQKLTDHDFESPERGQFGVTGKHDWEILRNSVWLTSILRYDDISHVGDRLSPKIGVLWFFSPGLSFKTNVGGAFRAPSFNELYLNTGFISGNPDLEPETGCSYDAGISIEKRRFRFEISAFQNVMDNLIRYELVSGFRYQPYNIGKSRSRGLELDGKLNLWKAFNLSGSYTRLDAVDRSDDRNYRNKRIPGCPEHDFSSRLAWDGEELTVFGEWRYVSGNYLTRANSLELEDRNTVNAGAGYRWNDFVQIGFEIKNLTDSEIVDVAGFPLPGRSFYVSLRFSR